MKPSRRQLLLGGAGAAATLGGAGAYLWRAGATVEASANALWQARFSQLDGQPLVMAGLRGAPLLVNFWATWCPPCIKEMPEIDRFAREFATKGLRVVGLAVDNPAPVREFLARAPVSYLIGLAGFEGTQLGRLLGNERGGLPFSVFFDARGRLVQRKLGETSFAELAGWMEPG